MATQSARRYSLKTDASVFKRLGKRNQENIANNHQVKNLVCKYWLQGRCTRNPCQFNHPVQTLQSISKAKYAWKNPNTVKSDNSLSSPVNKLQNSSPINKLQRRKLVRNKGNFDQHQIVPQKKSTSEVTVGQTEKSASEQKKSTIEVIVGQTEKSTSEGNVGQTENIPKKLQPGIYGNGLSMVTRLEGHKKGITGIALPAGSNKLFCSSKDKSLRVWDCTSGQCGVVVDFDEECGTLVNEGQWIFVGLKNMIKAWNLNTQHEVNIKANGGQVNAIIMFEDILFAGMEDGSILSWKCTSETSFLEEKSLIGHSKSVLSLVIGGKKLYSGSSDSTIRVWDCESLECKQVLNGHEGDVTSVLCWDQYLLSGSLDKEIKIWGQTENGNIEEVYQHNVDDGVLSICGMSDANGKPILLCSCKKNGVCLYDLPSFMERGRVVSKGDIQAIQIGPDGLFFTGDEEGLISVWKLS